MDKDLFAALTTNLEEAIDVAKGNKKARERSIRIKPVQHFTSREIKEIRHKLDMTQVLFAELLGVSKKSVEAWESDTNTPNGSAKRLLQLLDSNPQLARSDSFVEEKDPQNV